MKTVDEFMNKYSKIVDEISIEYIHNYKDKGNQIIGGANLTSQLKEEGFIEISKGGSKIEKDRERARVWNFKDCNNSSITASVANSLMNNLK
jgi:hypothetical protein